jgi:hypothetical protein
MVDYSNKKQKLSIREIEEQTNAMLRQSVGYWGDEVSEQRAELMSAYLGECYGDEDPERSQVVSTDIADTIDSIVPSLMRILLSGQTPAKFEASGPRDEEQADLETAAVSHVLMNQNNGYHVLLSAVLDALIQKNCVSKVTWEENKSIKTEEYGNLTEEELVNLLQELNQEYDKVDILEQDETRDSEVVTSIDPQTGQPIQFEQEYSLFSIKVKLTGVFQKAKIEPIPPEEFLVAPRHNSIYLDDCPFIAHKGLHPKSDAVEMGFDRGELDKLTSASDHELGDERRVRFEQRDTFEDDEYNSATRGMEEIMLNECYIKIDLDGDGIAELNKVFIGGSQGKILKWASHMREEVDTTYWPYAIEPVEEQPFAVGTAILLAHKFIGQSFAERIDDLQRINTVLWRQGLDNMYLSNNQSYELPEQAISGPETIDDILNTRPGKIIRTAEPGLLREIVPPQIFGHTIQALQYNDQVRAHRTGISYQAQGLDPSALNKDISGALFRQVQDASRDKIELCARTLVETYLRELYRKIRNTLRRHNSKPMVFKIADNWVQVDPAKWKDRLDLTVQVGIGNGNKEAEISNAVAMLQYQEKAAMHGLNKPIHVFNALEDLVNALGKRSVDRYFSRPNPDADWPPPQQPPNPLAEAQIIESQSNIAIKQGELALKEKEMSLKNELERDKLEVDGILKSIELKGKYDLEVNKQELDRTLKEEKEKEDVSSSRGQQPRQDTQAS